MTDFDPNWPHGHITRDGRKARIICTDRVGKHPIVSIIGENEASSIGGDLCRSMKDGRWDEHRDMWCDLFNAPEPKKEYWVNVFYYKNEPGRVISCTFGSKESADDYVEKYARKDGFTRIACAHVTEGDGL